MLGLSSAMMDNPGTLQLAYAMKRYRLASSSHERLVLDDGRELLLRPVAAADTDPIRAGFALLNPKEIRLRREGSS